MKEKPPIFGIIQRGGQVAIQMLKNVKQKTIRPVISSTIVAGTLVYTDEYGIYDRLPESGYRTTWNPIRGKLISHLALHEGTPSATKETHPCLEILSFYTPVLPSPHLSHHLDLAAYTPYRIALYQDKGKRTWSCYCGSPELLIQGV